MRLRIEKERTPPGKDALAFKTGVGGLIDAEFIAQALCLEQGLLRRHAERVSARLETARQRCARLVEESGLRFAAPVLHPQYQQIARQ